VTRPVPLPQPAIPTSGGGGGSGSGGEDDHPGALLHLRQGLTASASPFAPTRSPPPCLGARDSLFRAPRVQYTSIVPNFSFFFVLLICGGAGDRGQVGHAPRPPPVGLHRGVGSILPTQWLHPLRIDICIM